MKLLLDTHVFLWVDGEPGRLSPRARSLCEDSGNEILLSVASIWEMQLKIGLGKLALRAPLRTVIQDWTADASLKVLDVNANHVFRVESLPAHHKDPFDRLLIAQAQEEGCAMISHDRVISRYRHVVITRK
jgi:PIN domain nuclease of toxin-antitoxin system